MFSFRSKGKKLNVYTTNAYTFILIPGFFNWIFVD